MKSIAALLFTLFVVVSCAPVPPPIPSPAASASTAIAMPPPLVTITTAPNPSAPPALASPTGTAKPVTPSPGSTPTGAPAPAIPALTIPAFDHVYIIVMENKEYSAIVGSANAPYLNDLMARYGLATDYTGVSHPSQPNYLALFSGSTQGITDDAKYNLTGNHLADQIEAHGKSWRIFAQNVPLQCFNGSSASGGEDGPGTYARKHNPAISFLNVSNSASRCNNITNFAHFDPAVADYELIVPNMCNVMHDCSVETGDTFLKSFVPRILDSAAWQKNSVLFITWDEGNTDKGGGGQIPTIVISSRVTAGFKSSVPHNHYSLLRTIQDAWGLGCLENSCTANNLGEFFK